MHNLQVLLADCAGGWHFGFLFRVGSSSKSSPRPSVVSTRPRLPAGSRVVRVASQLLASLALARKANANRRFGTDTNSKCNCGPSQLSYGSDNVNWCPRTRPNAAAS